MSDRSPITPCKKPSSVFVPEDGQRESYNQSLGFAILSINCRQPSFSGCRPRFWNSLPDHVVTAATLQSFKKHLKTFLLQRSYSRTHWHFSYPRSVFGHLGHYNKKLSCCCDSRSYCM